MTTQAVEFVNGVYLVVKDVDGGSTNNLIAFLKEVHRHFEQYVFYVVLIDTNGADQFKKAEGEILGGFLDWGRLQKDDLHVEERMALSQVIKGAAINISHEAGIKFLQV